MLVLKKRVQAGAAAVLMGLSLAQVQADHHEESDYSMKASLNSDSFFGFYPTFQGGYKIDDSLSFAFYGIQWSGGTGAGWGNWTEFGLGVNWQSGGLSVTPQVGLLNGNLTSANTVAQVAEGFVPNITIGYGDDSFEAEIYAGYYYGLKGDQDLSNNYLHYWVNGGYKLNSFASFGLGLENLGFIGGEGQADDAAFTYYMAVGPYLQFADPKGKSFVRFFGASDLRDAEMRTKSGYGIETYFKLSLGFNLG